MSEDKTTYVAWFKVVNDPKWYTNEKEWDTYDRAFLHAKDKFRNWSQVEQFCAVKTGDDPNETKGE